MTNKRIELIKEVLTSEDTGLITLRERDIRRETQEAVKKDLSKVSLSIEDWAGVFLHAEKTAGQEDDSKVSFFKKLFLFSQRTGIDGFNWFPYHYGPFSRELDTALLNSESIKDREVRGSIIYSLSDDSYYREKFDKLPDSIKKNILDIAKEFKGIGSKKIVKLVYSAYPKYATVAIREALA